MELSKFRDKLLDGKLSRRQVARCMASIGVVPAVMPAIGSKAGAADIRHPNLFTWGGYDDPAFVVHYVEKHGREPDYSLFGDTTEAFNKMRGGFEPDMVMPCSGDIPLWHDAGLVVPINLSLLSNWDDMLEPLKTIPGTSFDGETFFVSSDWGQTAIMLRGDLAPEYADPENHTWGILWDEKYAGRLGNFDSLSPIVQAGVFLGIDPYNMNEEEIEIVVTKAIEAVKLTRMLSGSAQELSQALASGEVVATAAWNSFIWRTAEYSEGTDAEWVWMTPKEGALTWVCGFTIHPVAHRNGTYELCHEVIDSFISVESGMHELTSWYFGVANSKVYEKVAEEFLTSIGLGLPVEDYLADGVFDVAMQNEELITNRFEELKAGF